jgi:tRNA G18 (ribose-2'-O)-methylase SpoU
MIELILIAHNLRSAHNVGSLLRTAEGLDVNEVWLTGYTPYPAHDKDDRLPHLAQKTDKQIAKTALGAEKLVPWRQAAGIQAVLADLKQRGFTVAALEQAKRSLNLNDFEPPAKLALIVGREVAGLEPEILQACDYVLEIPMLGRKESFNVVQAAAMALYRLRWP